MTTKPWNEGADASCRQYTVTKKGKELTVRRTQAQRSNVMMAIISLIVVASMGLSMVLTLTVQRRVPPTPTATVTPFPTRTSTPPPA